MSRCYSKWNKKKTKKNEQDKHKGDSMNSGQYHGQYIRFPEEENNRLELFDSWGFKKMTK